MNVEARLGAATREARMRELLAAHPDAGVAAISAEGVRVDMPRSVPLTNHVVSGARSALFLVPPEERQAMIATWEEAHATGHAGTEIRLEANPDAKTRIEIIDVREAHGIFLGVLLTEADVAVVAEASAQPRPPRVARVRKDAVAVFLEVDVNTTEMLGWSVEELVGRRAIDIVHPDDQETGIESWIEMLASTDAGTPTRLRHLHKNGTWIWLEVTNTNRLADPQHEDVLTELVDISGEMAALEDLRARERLLDRIAEALPIGLCQFDADRRVVYTNERLHEILGTPRAATVDAQLSAVVRDDWSGLRDTFTQALDEGVDSDIEVQIQSIGRGRLRRCLAQIRALTDDDDAPNGAIVCIEDVTENAEMQAELERRASHDMLTRCYNRSSVMAALEVALAQGSENDTAVIYIDIDRFKDVNDRYGHAAGDELLVVVADRLAAAVRDDDIVGRVGGDEFLVVCSRVRSRREALEVAQRVADVLSDDVALAANRIPLRASIGVACSSGRNSAADELVGLADAAMYESKHLGVGSAVLADETRRVDLP